MTHTTKTRTDGATAYSFCTSPDCPWESPGCPTVGEAQSRGQAHAAERELERLNR